MLLAAMIVLMISATLRTGVRAWEAGQQKIGENYNRRTVLDLLKRQSSSIFFRDDINELMRQDSQQYRRTSHLPARDPRRRNQPTRREQMEQSEQNPFTFELPEGADYFKGAIQELSFLSTVSFLSDFPGQVAVRYSVVQGDAESGEIPQASDEETWSDEELDGESMEQEALVGNLYLMMEERNLFVSAITDAQETDLVVPDEEESEETEADELDEDETRDDWAALQGELQQKREMMLIGPLREFTIHYRPPTSQRGAHEADTEEDWVDTWNLDEQGLYPAAIEFVMFFETPGVTDDVDTEELDGIRMVIPVYHAQNMRREVSNAPF